MDSATGAIRIRPATRAGAQGSSGFGKNNSSWDLAPFSRMLGAWANNQSALYDELYAHLIGDALPITVARFTASKNGRVTDQAYKERRGRHLGQAAVTAALETAARLERLEEYRSVPDLESALKLVGKIGEHPAAESLEWISKLQQLVAERPDKFTKVILPSEEKILQELLKRALGVNRRKPVPRKKAAAKKTIAPKKKIIKKTALSKVPCLIHALLLK